MTAIKIKKHTSWENILLCFTHNLKGRNGAGYLFIVVLAACHRSCGTNQSFGGCFRRKSRGLIIIHNNCVTSINPKISFKNHSTREKSEKEIALFIFLSRRYIIYGVRTGCSISAIFHILCWYHSTFQQLDGPYLWSRTKAIIVFNAWSARKLNVVNNFRFVPGFFSQSEVPRYNLLKKKKTYIYEKYFFFVQQ